MKKKEKDTYVVTAKDRNGYREVVGEFEEVEYITPVRFVKTVDKSLEPEIWVKVDEKG